MGFLVFFLLGDDSCLGGPGLIGLSGEFSESASASDSKELDAEITNESNRLDVKLGIPQLAQCQEASEFSRAQYTGVDMCMHSV